MISLHISGVDSTGQYGHLKLLVGDLAIFKMLSRHMQWPQGRSTGGLSGVLCKGFGGRGMSMLVKLGWERVMHQARFRTAHRLHCVMVAQGHCDCVQHTARP